MTTTLLTKVAQQHLHNRKRRQRVKITHLTKTIRTRIMVAVQIPIKVVQRRQRVRITHQAIVIAVVKHIPLVHVQNHQLLGKTKVLKNKDMKRSEDGTSLLFLCIYKKEVGTKHVIFFFLAFATKNRHRATARCRFFLCS